MFVFADFTEFDDTLSLLSASMFWVSLIVRVSGVLTMVLAADVVGMEVGTPQTKSMMFRCGFPELHVVDDGDAPLRVRLFWQESSISAEGNLLTNFAECVLSASRRRSSEERDRGRGTLQRLLICST